MSRRVNIKAILANQKQRKVLLLKAAKAVSTMGVIGGGPHTIVRKVSVPEKPTKAWCRTCFYKKVCPVNREPNSDIWFCWCGSCNKNASSVACWECCQTVVKNGPPVKWRKHARYLPLRTSQNGR